jgi:hypothetical protein
MEFEDNLPTNNELLLKVKNTEKKNISLSNMLSQLVKENESLSNKLENMKKNELLSEKLEDEKNIEYKMIAVQVYLTELNQKCEQNGILRKPVSVIFSSNEKVLEKLTNKKMELETQLNHDIKTLTEIIQRILGIETYIEKQQRGGTKKNKKRQRKSRKNNKVLN